MGMFTEKDFVSSTPVNIKSSGGLDLTTEDGLKQNPQWIKDQKTIYKNDTGRSFKGTDEEVAEWGLGKQSKTGWNLTSAGLNAFQAQDWTPDVKEAWVRSLDSYEKTDPTLRSASRAAFWTIFDLPTLATFGWGAAAKAIGGKAAAAATRYSFKEALKKSLQQEAKKIIGPVPEGSKITKKAITQAISKIPKTKLEKMRKETANQVAWRTGLEQGAGVGAVYSGLFDLAAQDLETDVDPTKDDIDYARFAQNVLLGGGLGAVVGGAIPKVVEKLGRGKFIRDALNESAEQVDEIGLTPADIGFEDKKGRLEKQLAKEGSDKELAKNKDTYEIAEQEIKKIQEKKGTPANVIDEGTGAPKIQTIEKVDETTGKFQKIETLENVEKLKEKTGANVQGDDLQLNRTKSKQDKYINKDAKGKGDQDAIVMSNVAGRYDNKVLFSTVLKDKIKSLTDDGSLIINTGPRKKEKVLDYIQTEGKFVPSSQVTTEGKAILKGDKKSFDAVNKAKEKTRGKERVIEKVTGLDDKNLEDLLSENFKFIETKNINGKKVFIARGKIKYTPNTKPYKFKGESRFEKIFSFLGLPTNLQKVKNVFRSSAGLPKQLEKVSANKKAAIRAVGVRVQSDFKKLQKAMEDTITVNNVPLKDLAPKEYDAVLNNVNRALTEGEKEVFEQLPGKVQNEILKMRKSITDLRQRLLPKTADNPYGTGYIKDGTQLHKQIVQQIKDGGKPFTELRINRQYEIFDTPDRWLKKLKEAQEANPNNNPIQKAKHFFIEQLRLSDDISELNPDALPLSALYKAAVEAQRKGFRNFKFKGEIKKTDDVLAEVEDKEADALIDSFLRKYTAEELNDINKFGFDEVVGGTGEGTKVKGTFFKRKEIPPVIRDLLGEYKDPFVNYANTMIKLFQTYENHKFETAVRDLVKKGEFPGVSLRPNSMVGKSLDDATSLARGPDVDLPLQDLKADDVIFDAIKQGNDLAPLLNPAYKKILGLQAITRIAKTAYTPGAYPRNFAGAMIKAFGAGNLSISNIREVTKVFKGLRSFPDDDILAQTEKLTYLDIHGSGAKIGSLREALDEAINPNWWVDVSTMLGRADRLTASQKVRGRVEQANKKVLDLYQSMDDMWKWYSFETEKGNYRQVLIDKGINPDEVVNRWKTSGGKDVVITKLDEYAGEKVRAHMDNYGNVAQAFKFMRRLPVADFLAYKTEQVRTTWNIFETAIQDIKEGRALKLSSNGEKGNAQLAMGYKRLGSIISAVSLPTATATAMAYGYKNMNERAEIKIGGETYELPYSKIDAIREAALPDYAVGDDYMLIPGLQTKDGKDLRMFNISYIDPWAPLRAPILALIRGADGLRDLEEGAARGFKNSGLNLINSFGVSMFTDALLGASFGLDQYGRSISKPDDLMTDKAYDRLARFTKAFEPGIVRDLKRVRDSLTAGVTERGGFKLEPGGAAAKFVGIPYQYVEPKLSLRFKAAPLLKNMTSASSSFYNAVGTYHPQSEDAIVDAYKDTLRREYQSADKLARLLMAARSSGMDFKDIYNSITKDANFPKRFNKNIIQSMVLKGKFIPSTLPINKNLIMLKKHVEETTNQKVNLLNLQKELLQVYKSYLNEDFTVTKSLRKKEKN